MASALDYMQLCRLCLVKDKVNVPIFGDDNDVRQTFLKITACLPVKVSQNDNLPKKICDGCLYKVDLLYQFWNTTVNAEKQLLQWVGEIGADGNIKNANSSPLLTHAHPHSIQPEIILKEERHDIPDTPTETPQGFGQQFGFGPQFATVDINSSKPVSTASPAKRGRGRAILVKKEEPTATAVSTNIKQSTEESMDEDSNDRVGGHDDSDDSMEETGGRIAKEEAESEDEFDDTGESLEPTTFVGVPSETPEDQPGPSGLNKPATSTDTGISEFEDKNTLNMEPIITIVELEPNSDWNVGRILRKSPRNYEKNFHESLFIKEEDVSDEEVMVYRNTRSKVKKDIDEDYTPTKKKKKVEYKNPFVYDNLKKNKGKAVEKKKSKTKTKWSCLICNEDLKGKKELIDHYTEHKEDKIKVKNIENEVYQCHICLKEFTSEKRYEKHQETHNDSRFNCEYCEKTFKRPYDLAVHMRFHSNDDKLKCNVCDYTTQYNSALKTHIKRHESEYKYKCEICNKGFFCVTWYEEHKNFHSGAKPFSCDLCGKKFAYTRYMMAHKRSMHPESFTDVPVVNECQFCQKRFAHKKSLLIHVRSHTGENTVLCDICGKRLSSNDHLKLHRRIHTGYKPYSCTVCGKSFSKKCNLTLHLRVHSGEKPYICELCGKCFSQRSTLVIHTRYHTGQRPYVCHLCNKGFVAKGVLGIHLKSCNRHNIMGRYLESVK